MRAFLDTSPIIIILEGTKKYNDENWKKKNTNSLNNHASVYKLNGSIEFSLGKRIPVKTRV